MLENDKTVDEFGGLAEEKSNSDQILRKFKRKSVAASEWIDSIVKNGYRKPRSWGKKRYTAATEEGLFMSDEMQSVGILSIAPSLSALLSEIGQLRDDNKIVPDAVPFAKVLSEDKNNVLNVVVNSICKLIMECYPEGLKESISDVMFTSAPFYEGVTVNDTSVWEGNGYLDTASWICLVADLIENFLDRLERVAPDLYKSAKWKVYEGSELEEILTVDQVRDYIGKIYRASIRVTCDCIVKKDGKYLGWSFRKMNGAEVEPSLYFSYVASTVYLGLYKRFNGDKDMIDEMRKFEYKLDNRFNKVSKFKYWEGFKSQTAFERMREWMSDNGFDRAAEFLKKLTDDDIKELDLLYNVINDGKPLLAELSLKYDKFGNLGSFTELKEASLGLAESLWNEGFGTYKDKIPFKVNMAKGPCFEDGKLVDMETVRLSSHNNAFFNNLFVIGIILNSAYDAELERKSPAEYERMLNTFQLSIQNTQRCYNEIEDENLLYKIDSYILDFSDKVDSDNAELAKQLRRVNMSVAPLLPLMLKNTNLMSEYVVKYPQKEMTESLKNIIKNRKIKDNESCWVWDKDGYNAITNYYYVDALISFYRYYERFEEPLIDNEEARRKAEDEAIASTTKKLEEDFAVQKKGINEVKARMETELKEYRGVFKSLARLLVNELIDVVDEQITVNKLIGELSLEEKNNREVVIRKLDSFDKDSDDVKLSSLVHLTEKLQILSLLTMTNDERLRAFISNGSEGNVEEPGLLVTDLFGGRGDSSKFIRKLLVHLNGNTKNTDDKD